MGGRLAVVGGHSIMGGRFAAGGAPRPADGGVQLLDTEHCLVLQRHGDPTVPAHLVDHVANLRAVAAAGCDRVLAIGSVGSLRLDWPVGTVVAPDDLYAPQVNVSVFDDARGHSVPGFDAAWRSTVVTTWRAHASSPIEDGGVYAQTTGPRFETPAEIRALARAADLVGMTLAAECIVARELGLAYAAVCVVDNLGNGLGERALTPEEFYAGARANRDRLDGDLAAVVPVLVTP